MFNWKQRFIDDPDLNVNDAIGDKLQIENPIEEVMNPNNANQGANNN